MSNFPRIAIALSALASIALPLAAQTPVGTIEDKLSIAENRGPGPALAPEFETDYELLVLGSAEGVPPQYGGVFILPAEPDTLYIGGAANGSAGALYAIGLVRDSQSRITGFSGTAVRVADAPFNDGGIVRDPGGLISYAQWPANRYGQIDLATGTLVTDIDLAPFGVAGSSASVAFVPPGYPGAGGMRIASWSGGQFYAVDYTVGAGGLIAIDAVTQVSTSTLPGGPEGWAYVPLGSPQFPQPSMIVSEFSAGEVAVFELDAAGNPVVASRRLFISGLTGAEGATIDPLSGAFVFSTFGGGDQVVVVNGFGLPPGGELAPASFDFGALPVGDTSPTQVFTLTNTAQVDLQIDDAAVIGDYYELTANSCPQGGSLAAGTNCTIEIACTPTAVGPQAGTLTVATNAGDLTSNLQCAGEPLPEATLMPASFDYGTLPIGDTSPAQAFTLSNTGAVDLLVTGAVVAGGYYALAANDCPQGGALAAGASCVIDIACTPTAVGPQAGTLTVSTDAGDLASSLQCAGEPLPEATLTPASFDYGTLPVGNASPAQTFTLNNTGAVELQVAGATIVGDYYAITANDCPQGGPLAVGAGCIIEIVCTPAAVGAQAGTLTVATDAGDLASTLQCAGAPVAPPGPAMPVPAIGRWALWGLLLGVLVVAFRFRNVGIAGRR